MAEPQICQTVVQLPNQLKQQPSLLGIRARLGHCKARETSASLRTSALAEPVTPDALADMPTQEAVPAASLQSPPACIPAQERLETDQRSAVSSVTGTGFAWVVSMAAADIKLFGKWSYEEDEVKVRARGEHLHPPAPAVCF